MKSLLKASHACLHHHSLMGTLRSRTSSRGGSSHSCIIQLLDASLTSSNHHVGRFGHSTMSYFRSFSTIVNRTQKSSSSTTGKKGSNFSDNSDDDGEDIFDKLKKLGFLGQGSPEVKKHLENMMDFMLKPGKSMPTSSSSSTMTPESSEAKKEEKPKPLNTFLEDEEKLIESFNRVVFEAYKLHRNSFESQLTPEEIVNSLDKHIVGQRDAKRAVAIALRNRFRRKTLIEWYNDKSRPKTTLDPSEIIPKNILMIGPTGYVPVCILKNKCCTILTTVITEFVTN